MIPGAESIRHSSRPGGWGEGPKVLLCHGFTSSPLSMADWAADLAEAGYQVSVPRLPGHGRTWQELNRTCWQDWYDRVERELLEMSDQAQTPIAVGGLSMGGALALRLAIQHPSRVQALLLVNPAVLITDPRLKALPVLRRILPTLKGLASDIADPSRHEPGYARMPLNALASSVDLFRDVEANLPRVSAPLLMFRSRTDHVVPAASPRRVLDRVSSRDVSDVLLENSFHVATMDYDAPLIFSSSRDFLERLGIGAGAAA